MLPDAPLTASCSGPEIRNDLSLAHDGCASRRLHPGVIAPGLLLPPPARFLPARSALQLRYLPRFAPVPAASSPRARCRFSARRYSPCRPLPLPFRTLTSLRLNASMAVQPVGPPIESARSPLAPRCRPLFNSGRGSSFLVRYVFLGLLFLKPLGTFFTMPAIHRFVKWILYVAVHFQQKISRLLPII